MEVSQSTREFPSTEDYTFNKSLILPVAVNRRKDKTMLYRVFFNVSNAVMPDASQIKRKLNISIMTFYMQDVITM